MSTINSPLPDKALAGANAPLDEVMLAMDVVDTLRHDEAMLEKDLTSAERRADLVARLRSIYAAQGIEVPDHILEEGVSALEDERFAYHPPKAGLGRSLGKIYINRRKWGRPLIFIAAMAGLAWTVNYAAIEGPAKARAEQQASLLTEHIPARLESARSHALDIASTEELRALISTLYDEGVMAAQNGQAEPAEAVTERLEQLSFDLHQIYTVRIVSRPGESSGVFRLNDDNQAVKNYYLIVEAISPSGETLPITISSEEDQVTRRVKIWGVRVPAQVYNTVAADKQDDQIIQDAIIGTKTRGTLEPIYSVNVLGGRIISW